MKLSSYLRVRFPLQVFTIYGQLWNMFRITLAACSTEFVHGRLLFLRYSRVWLLWAVNENITINNLLLYIKFAETYCSSFFKVKESDDHLWKLTGSFFWRRQYRNACSATRSFLCAAIHPRPYILFTLDGPVPCTKVMLECRECFHVYGVCNHRDESGTRFYPEDFNIDLVEVSNVTYFHFKLYKWFPSLRLVNYIHAFKIICQYYIF